MSVDCSNTLLFGLRIEILLLHERSVLDRFEFLLQSLKKSALESCDCLRRCYVNFYNGTRKTRTAYDLSVRNAGEDIFLLETLFRHQIIDLIIVVLSIRICHFRNGAKLVDASGNRNFESQKVSPDIAEISTSIYERNCGTLICLFPKSSLSFLRRAITVRAFCSLKFCYLFFTCVTLY